MDLIIDKIDYHRNGVCGVGFFVILFRWQDEDAKRERNMLGVVFPYEDQPQNPRVAVFDRDLLTEGNIDFGVNSWRGDHFADQLLAVTRGWGTFTEDPSIYRAEMTAEETSGETARSPEPGRYKNCDGETLADPEEKS